MSAIQKYIYEDLASLNKSIQEARIKAEKLAAHRIIPMQFLPVMMEGEQTHAINVLEKVIDNILDAHEKTDDLMMAFQGIHNPVTSFKIDEPRKHKKTKWWAVNFTDANNNIIKSVIVDARTKTEIRLLVKSKIGQLYQSQEIRSAIVEGPYKSMMDATQHRTMGK